MTRFRMASGYGPHRGHVRGSGNLVGGCTHGSHASRSRSGTIAARAPVAQWIERSRPKAGVGGSNPSGGASTPTLVAKSGSHSGSGLTAIACWSLGGHPLDDAGDQRHHLPARG